MRKSPAGSVDPLKRIQGIQNRIARFDLVCSGCLHTRTKVCGKPGCRCTAGPEGRHGPYYEWSRLEEGKLIHSVVSAPEAKLLERAIGNYQNIRQLLKNWQDESLRVIRGAEHPGGERKRRGN